MRREDYLAAVGDYDLRLRYHEDRDLGLRLLRIGARPVFERRARAPHLHARSLDAYLAEARRGGHSAAILHALHEDVLGPFELEVGLDRFPAPARALVRLTDRPRARVAALAALRLAVHASQRLGLAKLESGFASLARKIAERRGAVESREARVTGFALGRAERTPGPTPEAGRGAAGSAADTTPAPESTTGR